jgi:nucleoside-diphosphate-sugar epimerase
VKVVVIGGTGHIGTYLVPRLAEAGHEVTVVSRKRREPYQPLAAWSAVKRVTLDRGAEEAAGRFGSAIREMQPDVVMDLICFTLESCRHLVDALKGNVSHFLHCGTMWVHGPSITIPVTEEQPRKPFGDYGIQKAAIESYLLKEARQSGFPATALHPGHIVGPGWIPVNPQGNFDPQVFSALAAGEELTLPNLGMETVHHVHADDVAQVFMQAMVYWSASVGQSFHVVSPAAINLRGYAEAVSGWFGREPRLRFLPWDEWKKTVSEGDAGATWDHIAHSPCGSIAKAERLLDYRPRYSSLQAVYEAVRSMEAGSALR